MDDGLREHDPYRGMKSAEDEARPEFLRNPKGTASGEKVDSKSDKSAEQSSGNRGEKAERNREAAENLSSAESEASGDGPKKTEDSVSGARENEENADGFYSGKGKDKDEKQGRRGGIGFKGKLKKRAPILAIFMTIFGIGGAMFGAQSLLPFAISELLIEKFNSIGVSASIVSDEMLDLQLNQGIRQGAPDPSNTDTLFGLSEYQVQQFKINGIDAYNIEAGGSEGAVMLYKKHGGTITVPVVGSVMLGAAKEKKIKKEVADISGLDSASIGTPIGVKDALDDKDFYVPYTSASKVWRNGTSSWFDKIMKNVTEIKLNITRSRWANFVARRITDASLDLKGEFNKTAAGTSKIKDAGVDVRKDQDKYEDIPVYNEETGEQIGTKHVNVGKEEVSEGTVSDGGDYGDMNLSEATTVGSIQKVLTSKAVRAAQGVANAVCGIAKGAVAVYTVVQANQALQFLNLVTGFLEAVDRVKAGDGDTSPVMEYSSNLTTTANTKDGNGNVVAEKRTAIASAGMSWLFNKTKINSEDPSVKNTNFESIMSNLSIDGVEGYADKILKKVGDIKTLSEVMKYCGYVEIGDATVSIVTDVIALVGTVGVGNIIKFFAKKIASAAVGAVVASFVGVLLGNVIQSVAKLFIKNTATEWFGEDLGNALVSGGSRYLGGNGTSGGQGPGTKAAVTAYLVSQQDVIAKEAEYQRAIRSPFDITSQYTFLGSLAYSLIPLAYSGGGLMSALTSVAATASSAVVAMLPTANAIETNADLSSTGSCPLLEGADIVGDAFCNPYIITDANTTNLLATTVYDAVHYGISDELASVGHSGVKKSHFENNGQISNNSDLAKYVTYCGQRTSQYNTYDVSIAAQVKGEDEEDSVGTILLKEAPIIGDLGKIINNVALEKNIDWVNGRECIVGGRHWGENKYYQRYTENERLLEGMNPDYTSPVTAYLEDYYKENPLDTSFEGTLARFSGQTKEDVELALNLIEYYDYIDNYDPTTRYAFVEPEEKEPIFFENTTEVPELSPALALESFKIVYTDLRGRYYTV